MFSEDIKIVLGYTVTNTNKVILLNVTNFYLIMFSITEFTLTLTISVNNCFK